ncbi:MAG: thioredoxin family protein [Spirosomataceae bacterium]
MNLINYPLIWQNAVELPDYWRNFETELSTSQKQGPHAAYLPINWQRVQRINKQLQLHQDWAEWISTLKSQINWLIISEHWCGDAAQILPVVEKMAQQSEGKVNIKVIYRDQNLEVMDRHLTQGSRSIPKIIGLDSNFHLLGDWGPRPKEAQALRAQFPTSSKEYADALHLWYGRNKQVAIQKEVLDWIKSII